MVELPGEPAGSPSSLPAGDVTDDERAFVLACLAWPEWPDHGGLPTLGEAQRDFEIKIWSWIEAGWLKRASAIWAYETERGQASAQAALNRLRALHAQASRLDPARIDPSWLVRGLREESAAVARTAVDFSPERVRGLLARALAGHAAAEPRLHPPAPEVAAWVRSLWTERLVGGRAETELDPPEIAALAELSRRSTLRLCRLWGFAKLALAGALTPRRRPRKVQAARAAWIATQTMQAPESLRDMARADLKELLRQNPKPRALPHLLGAQGLARLLRHHDPYRLRWALQHVPYPIAKHLRSAIPRKLARGIAEHERTLLKLTWIRLNLEHRIKHSWPGESAPAASV